MKTSTPSLRPPRLKSRAAQASASLGLKPRGTPLIMGVLNITPDSFFPASRIATPSQALEKAQRMVEEGADWLDIGGQSTRPGSRGISTDEELRRVIPVVESLAAKLNLPLSIDTDKAVVARRAREAGARILNDVTALRADSGMMTEAVRFEAVILMHMRGTSPQTMQSATEYKNVVTEVKEFLVERQKKYMQAGGNASRLLVDPGIGFGKNLEQNLELIRRLDVFTTLGPPVVLGVSRKSFLGRLMAGQRSGADIPAENLPGPEERLEGSLAAACWAMLQGAAVLRVHDVLATKRALATLAAIRGRE